MYTTRLLSHVLAVLLPVAAAPVLAGPAHADHSSESNSTAQFLSGSVLGSDQSTVVGIDGASAEYRDGHTAGTEDYENENLDVTALSAINLELGNELTVGDLLQLGVVEQEAWAGPDGDSWATTGTTDASLNLMAMLPPNDVLQTASLDLGAISSYAEVDGETGQLTRTTEIAEVTLDLQSQLIADTTAEIDALTDTLVTQIDALEPVVTDAVNDSVGQVLALLGITGDVTSDTTVSVDTSRLDAAIAGLLSEPLCTDLVCVNPTTGAITADLAGGVNLNALAPNTRLTGALTQVSGDVELLLAQLQADLDELLTNALDHVDVSIQSTSTVTDPILGTVLGTLDISYLGTLQDLLDGSQQPELSGSGAVGTALDLLIAAATELVQDTIATVVNDALGTIVADTGTAVDSAVTELAAALDPALDSISGLLDITLNAQNVAANGIDDRAWVSAIQIEVLDGVFSGADIDLATSSVGPNAFVRTTPTTPSTPSTPVETDPVDNTATGAPPVDNTAADLDTAGPAEEKTGSDTTSTTDAVLPATGSPFGVGALVLLALWGMGMIAAGASLVRQPVVRS